jgi:rod shape-determining protein MreC
MQSPRLDFIVGAQSLRDGERIITSGDGGLYPRGIGVGIARRERNGGWYVALAASQRPIDFVRLIPYVGIEAPEASASANQSPPLSATSSVAVIFHEVTPAPASAVTAAPPRPRVAPTQTAAAATPAATQAAAVAPAAAAGPSPAPRPPGETTAPHNGAAPSPHGTPAPAPATHTETAPTQAGLPQ